MMKFSGVGFSDKKTTLGAVHLRPIPAEAIVWHRTRNSQRGCFLLQYGAPERVLGRLTGSTKERSYGP